MNERTISSNGSDRPSLTISASDLEAADLAIGEAVHVEAGDGYLLVTRAESDLTGHDLGTARTNPAEPPVRSEMEARIVGNRLWYAAERLDEKNGVGSVVSETKQFARRFHRLAKTREDLAEAAADQLEGTA